MLLLVMGNLGAVKQVTLCKAHCNGLEQRVSCKLLWWLWSHVHCSRQQVLITGVFNEHTSSLITLSLEISVSVSWQSSGPTKNKTKKTPRLFPKMTSEVFNFQLVSFFLLSGFFLFLCRHHCNGLYFCSFVPSLCYSIKSIIAHISTAREGFFCQWTNGLSYQQPPNWCHKVSGDEETFRLHRKLHWNLSPRLRTQSSQQALGGKYCIEQKVDGILTSVWQDKK